MQYINLTFIPNILFIITKKLTHNPNKSIVLSKYLVKPHPKKETL